MVHYSEKHSRMNKQWRNHPTNGNIGKLNFTKKVKTDSFSNYNRFYEDVDDKKKNAYLRYAGKLRKPAVKTNPVIKNLNSVIKCRNVDVDEKTDTYEYRYTRDQFVLNENMWMKNGSYYDDEKWINSVETRMWMLNEFRRVYRETTASMKPSVRRDLIARKEMMEKYKYFEPTQIVGHVPGVKVGDEFELRIELTIMGLHFQLIHGIDFMITCPYEKLLATSVVATEGYEDDLMDNDMVLYRGEGGNFESGSERGKMSKDQVWKGGNLALRNSMKKGNDVRVIRGFRCGWDKKVLFVYDGLYKVDDYREICGHFGNKQFEFKLVRCPGQKRINWSRYRYNSCRN